MSHVISIVTSHQIVVNPVRNGGESAKHAMVYSALYHGLDRLGIVGWGRSLGSSFVASFVCGVRNGRRFGLRNGIGSVGSTLVHDVLGRVRRH